MTRLIEISVMIVLVLLVISIVVLPWPANVILGGIALFTFIITFIYTKQVKKKEEDTQQGGEGNR